MKKTKGEVLVGIIIGSESDLDIMREAEKVLTEFGLGCELTVASAHRSPKKVERYASEAKAKGLKVLIVGAGMAAHLPGVVAAHTTLPVIGVPLNVSPLNGLDSLLSIVQMPSGIPVATMSIGAPGARNAGLLSIAILALHDKTLERKLDEYRLILAKKIDEADGRVGGHR